MLRVDGAGSGRVICRFDGKDTIRLHGTLCLPHQVQLHLK
jgi:hypothetical protein